MDIVVRGGLVSPASQPVEVVERKGLGHPDTICDAVAEYVCVQLCRYYLDHFGVILHHNVDKVLLCGGASRSAFGGGEVIEPIEIYLAGRATQEWRGRRIPVHEIAQEACRACLRRHLPELDVDRHVRVTSRIRPGSADLTRLFARADGDPPANDTSCGAGFAPLTDLERTVLEVESVLNSPKIRTAHPAIGSDIKVMGVRRNSTIHLTVGCAFIDRCVRDLADYISMKAETTALVLDVARRVTSLTTTVVVNAADDVARGDVFLTVTGTSAEAGDDGEVGRGNRTSGLITPYRPMTLEAAAGKNPVSHVGKLYNLAAARIAAVLAERLPSTTGADCVIVSEIGRPVTDPQLVDIRLASDAGAVEPFRNAAEEIVHTEFAGLSQLRAAVLGERVRLY